MEIIPALIVEDDNPENDFEELKAKFEKIKPFLNRSGNWVQIDIIDGKFVETKTKVDFEKLIYFTSSANVDFHLMIESPERTIDEWILLVPKRITVHVESTNNIDEIIKKCRAAGVEIGLALNPETPNSKIEPWLNFVDLILYLGVHPGRGGQEFISEVLDKIKSLRREYPNVKIAVDGGVKIGLTAELKKAGVNIIIVGSGILKAPDPAEAFDALVKDAA